MKVSKGLGCPGVTLAGVGYLPAKGEEEQEAARVFYVAATRAKHRVVIGVGGDGRFGNDWDDNRSIDQLPPTFPRNQYPKLRSATTFIEFLKQYSKG